MEIEITLKNIVDWILKGIVFILVLSLIFGIGSFVLSKYFIKPVYEAEVKFYASGTETNTSASTMYNYYKSVAYQYIEFLNVDEFFDQVSTELMNETGKSLSVREVEKLMKISSVVDQTASFYVTVETNDPQLSYQVAMAIAKSAPKRISSFSEVGDLEVISYPIIPAEPSGPNVIRNTFLGLIIGFVLAAGIVILQEMMDNRIKTPEEITELFGLPIFGIVPDFSTGEKKGASK
ncbi:MAG: hypothetical protein IKD31_05165 [Clostridia bacterium]|nr:hypothetical protein [Clostridia bacterium]